MFLQPVCRRLLAAAGLFALLFAVSAHADVLSVPDSQYGTGTISCKIRVSPDGSTYATGSHDGTVRLWDVSSGQFVRSFTGIRWREVTGVAFSPDGGRIAACAESRAGFVWNVADGSLVCILGMHKNGIRNFHDIVFSPDGTKLLTANFRGSASLWDAETGGWIRDLNEGIDSQELVWGVAFSPDGSIAVTTGGGWPLTTGSVRLWDAATGALMQTFSGHTDTVSCAAFSPDGTRLLTGSGDGTVRVWKVPTGRELLVYGEHERGVYDVSFSHGGDMALTTSAASYDNVRVWNVATGANLTVASHGSYSQPSAAFLPDDAHILTAYGMVRKWSLPSGTETAAFGGHRAYEGGFAVSPRDMTIAVAPEGEHRVLLLNPVTGESFRSMDVFSHPTISITSLAFSPDGTKLAVATNGCPFLSLSLVVVIDLPSGGSTVYKRDSLAGYCVAFSPDGKSLLAGRDSRDGGANTAFLWDLGTIEARRVFTGHTGGIVSVAFSPDGTSALTAAKDGTARAWDIEGGHERLRLEGGRNNAVFSPDGTKILTSAHDTPGKIWDAASGALLLELEQGYSYDASFVCYSPDGGRISAAAAVYDANTGKVLRSLVGAQGISVFSPDGSHVLTQCAYGAVASWPVEGGTPDIALPKLRGMWYVDACKALEDAGLHCVRVFTECSGSDSDSAGQVVDFSPAPIGDYVAPGSPVNLAVTLGPCTPPATKRELKARLAKTFTLVDKNGDGVVTYEEACAAFPGLPREVFDDVDADHDGQISAAEAGWGVEEDARCGCFGGDKAASPATLAERALLMVMTLLG